MKIVRNILAVVAGIFVGGWVNMAIINESGSIIPGPEGVNVTDAESLKANIHLFSPKHFILPFLAHAVGTLVGALIAALIGIEFQKRLSAIIGFVFLAGGIGACFMIPAPAWFMAVDLIFAYIPMALAGWKIATLLQKLIPEKTV